MNNKKRPLCSDYTLHNQKLNVKTEAKYLGMPISSELSESDLNLNSLLVKRQIDNPSPSWSRHADHVTKKANSTIGFLKRNMRSAPQAAKDTTYKTFVRPIVEYAATAWAPSTDKANDKIVMVQRRAARFVKNDYGRTSSVTEIRIVYW